MLIDEKGKLFGKINLLDLLVILILVAAIAFGGWYFMRGKAEGAGKLTVRYIVEVVEKDPEYFDYIIPGESVVDGVTKQPMGRIVSFETKPTKILAQNNRDMTLVYDEVEGKLNGNITIEVEADVSYPDLLSGNEKIKIGKDVAYRSESAAMKGYIIGIEYDEEKLEAMR